MKASKRTIAIEISLSVVCVIVAVSLASGLLGYSAETAITSLIFGGVAYFLYDDAITILRYLRFKDRQKWRER